METVPLRDYLDMRLTEVKEAAAIALSNVEKSTALAATQLDKRLDNMNEFRAQLDSQVGTFITKELVDEKLQLRDVKIETIQKLVYVGLGIILAIEVVGGGCIYFLSK